MNTTSPSSITELRAQLIEAGQAWSAGQHRLIGIVGAIDRSNLWIADGATSAAAWIAAALDIETCTAREWVRIGRSLALLPLIDAAFRDGRLSYSKVRAVTRVAIPGCETELLELAESVPASHLNREIAAWRAQHEDPGDTEHRHQRDRCLSTWVDHDGMLCGHFRLPPLPGGSLVAAIETDVMRHDPTDARDRSAGASQPSLPTTRGTASRRARTAPHHRPRPHLRGRSPCAGRRRHAERRHPYSPRRHRAHRTPRLHPGPDPRCRRPTRQRLRTPTTPDDQATARRRRTRPELRRLRRNPPPQLRPRPGVRNQRSHRHRRATTAMRTLPPPSPPQLAWAWLTASAISLS